MPRDPRAYLLDVVEACDAIASAVNGIDLGAYQCNRLIGSAVEREFTMIGEAMLALSSMAPEIFASISHARRIVDFRNPLTYEYRNINNTVVWAIADRDVPVLRRECAECLERLG